MIAQEEAFQKLEMFMCKYVQRKCVGQLAYWCLNWTKSKLAQVLAIEDAMNRR